MTIYRFNSSVRTTPEALLRLIRQPWSMENEWHWSRDVQLGVDAHRYTDRTGVAVFSFLRTVVMDLLRRGGYRSIRKGLRELAYNTKAMLALRGVATPPPSTAWWTFGPPWRRRAVHAADINTRALLAMSIAAAFRSSLAG